MDLRCPACGRRYEDRWRCRCESPLRFSEQLLASKSDPNDADIDPKDGLWAFSEFLPVERRVSLGEGYTPLVDAPEWNAAFKLEYVFPTGSFKDRGATTTLSRALEVGADRVIEDSSGNAGAAIATYAARAGSRRRFTFQPASKSRSYVRSVGPART